MSAGEALRRVIAFDGIVWAGLALMSALALFDRLQPPWLLTLLWLSLHPLAAVAYLFVPWSSGYPRYAWAMRAWITFSTWAWAYQSLFFVAHVVADGFFADMAESDSLSASIAALLALSAWSDAAWIEAVKPFRFARLGEVREHLRKTSGRSEARPRENAFEAI